MFLSEQEVKKIAKLARIRITEAEATHFSEELTQILDWVEQLKEVDTDDIEEMVSTTENFLPMREDKVTEPNLRDQILANAPEAEYGCFLVPKVVE